MSDNNFESTMIVSSNNHLKRSEQVFDCVNDDGKIFKYISSANLNGDTRLDREDAFSHWLGEFIKVCATYLVYISS